jgi:hypothetical protein
MKEIFVSNIHKWQAFPENPKEKPKLEFVDALFKRRLSQCTRMTIQVLHDLLEEFPDAKDLKQVFVSFRGEIEREFTINKGIIEDSEILPAGFSLSVFNTPIAAASLALKLKAGYSVVYPSKGDFYSAFLAAASAVLSGSEEKIVFVYADEYVPEQYGKLQPENNAGIAFACVLSATESKDSVSINCAESEKTFKSPFEFLEKNCR